MKATDWRYWVFLLLLVLGPGCGSSHPDGGDSAEPLTGSWSGMGSMLSGIPELDSVRVDLELEQDGETVTGTFSAHGEGPTPIYEGRIENDTLTFSLNPDIVLGEVRSWFIARLDGDRLKGTWWIYNYIMEDTTDGSWWHATRIEKDGKHGTAP